MNKICLNQYKVIPTMLEQFSHMLDYRDTMHIACL